MISGRDAVLEHALGRFDSEAIEHFVLDTLVNYPYCRTLSYNDCILCMALLERYDYVFDAFVSYDIIDNACVTRTLLFLHYAYTVSLTDLPYFKSVVRKCNFGAVLEAVKCVMADDNFVRAEWDHDTIEDILVMANQQSNTTASYSGSDSESDAESESADPELPIMLVEEARADPQPVRAETMRDRLVRLGIA